MKHEQDDELFSELFGDEKQPAPAAQAASAPSRPKRPAAPEPAPAPPKPASAEEIQEALGRDAARMFSSMMAEERKAQPQAAPAAQAEAAPEPPPAAAPVPQPQVASAPFKESLEPWTLFRGFAVLGMLTYIAGFHGRLLRDAWGPLLVITTALAGLVLIIDFVRLAPAKEKPARGKPRKK